MLLSRAPRCTQVYYRPSANSAQRKRRELPWACKVSGGFGLQYFGLEKITSNACKHILYKDSHLTIRCIFWLTGTDNVGY